ncbi:MAG: flagellar motor protein MotB [Steroidobacteraceae bacterium]
MAGGGQGSGDERPLIIVKRYKRVEGGHHGGAWKIAYADFVTAMMAFFLVMWLVASISKQERAAIFEMENKRLEALLKELQEAIAKGQALKPFKDQLLLDIMPEGLRIQIVDSQNRPMFDVGRAKLKDYTVSILKSLAPYLASVPNRISITGHTDATPYPGSHDYSNWELSADRANAARRVLVSSGVPETKIGRIVGLADSAPIDRADPVSPVNRRISIIVMTHEMDATPEGLAVKPP